jgi:hypothetical protein
MSNDATNREQRWRRHDGDCWACFDALPPAVRWRMQQNAYDVWSVNALMLWRSFRRQLASSHKAERRCCDIWSNARAWSARTMPPPIATATACPCPM